MSSGKSLRLSDCTMRTIQGLHQELVRLLAASGSVSLDRTDVQRPNTALLQLLAVFARDLRAQSRSIEWCGESAPFDRAARALGLSASLGLPAAVDGDTA
jgi:ABC-type transporter Mla MlaB component